jgi:aspartate kinase
LVIRQAVFVRNKNGDKCKRLINFQFLNEKERMKVFKFGGASVSTTERISKVKEILKSYSGEKILVVISAMGKTTNALEKVAEAFFDSSQKEALNLFEAIKQQHIDLAKQIILKSYDETYTRLVDIFTEAEWLLHDKPHRRQFPGCCNRF